VRWELKRVFSLPVIFSNRQVSRNRLNCHQIGNDFYQVMEMNDSNTGCRRTEFLSCWQGLVNSTQLIEAFSSTGSKATAYFKCYLWKILVKSFACLMFVVSPYSYGADAEVSTLKFGMSTALSGSGQYFGLSLYRGMNTYFKEVNQGIAGQEIGVLGRQIEVIVMDDSYVPATAVSNVRKLIQQDGVLAIIGNFGTPTFQEVWDEYYLDISVSDEHKVAIYGAYSGAAQLRGIEKANHVFNYRASYDEEMAVIVDHIVGVSGISPNRIAFLLQGKNQTDPDAYGEAGYQAAVKALLQEPYYFEGGERLTQGIYIRNQFETNNAIEKMLKLQRDREAPEAIIIVATHQASANFILFMHGLFPNTNFYNLSPGGAGELGKSLSARGIANRVYMTQVVAMTQTEKLPSDLIEREGYLAAKELVSAIRNCFDKSSNIPINSVSIKRALAAYFKFGKSCLTPGPVARAMSRGNQLSRHVELSRLFNSSWIRVDPQENGPQYLGK